MHPPIQAGARLRNALRREVEGSEQTAAALSEDLGRHPGHVDRILRGKAPLRVEEVLALLDLTEADPFEFFVRTFPLGLPEGSEGARFEAAGLGAGGSQVGLGGLSDLLRGGREERRAPARSSISLALDAGRRLRAFIGRNGTSIRAVAEELGRSRASLGRALRGQTSLTFETVFDVLAVLEVRPGRFFAELFGPVSDDLMEGLSWRWLLDSMERDLTGAINEARGKGRSEADGADTEGADATGAAGQSSETVEEEDG